MIEWVQHDVNKPFTSTSGLSAPFAHPVSGNGTIYHFCFPSIHWGIINYGRIFTSLPVYIFVLNFVIKFCRFLSCGCQDVFIALLNNLLVNSITLVMFSTWGFEICVALLTVWFIIIILLLLFCHWRVFVFKCAFYITLCKEDRDA